MSETDGGELDENNSLILLVRMEASANSPAEHESAAQKHISMEEEFKEWGSKTTFGVLAGMLYGGSKEAVGSAVWSYICFHGCFMSLLCGFDYLRLPLNSWLS